MTEHRPSNDRDPPPDRIGVCGLCQRASADPTVRTCTNPNCPLLEKEAA